MCPEHERAQRVQQNDVWPEETDPDHSPYAQGRAPVVEDRMVKKFRRAAAGLEEQLPSDLRPPHVLKRTCDYLFDEVVASAPNMVKVHHFVWDRTRAIRNDFSIQQLSKAEDLKVVIDCYERIARFHILSLHQLALEQKAHDRYDAQQDREQLDRTLLSLMQYYDDSRGRLDLPNEAEFRAYCIIFQLQDPIPDMEDRVQGWPRHILLDPRVRTALEIYATACNTTDLQGPINPYAPHLVAQQDWQKFWNTISSKRTSYLMACVAEIYFNLVRRTALQSIWHSFRMKRDRTPDVFTMDLLLDIFQLDDEEQVVKFCEAYGFGWCVRADGERYLDLASLTKRVGDSTVDVGSSLPAPNAGLAKQWRSELVEGKRFGRTIPSLINGMNVKEAEEAGETVQEEREEDMEESNGDEADGVCEAAVEEVEEDQESLFIPDQTSNKPQKPSTTGLGSFGAQSSSPFAAFGQPSTAGSGISTFGNPSPQSGVLGAFGRPSPSEEKPQSPFSFGLGQQTLSGQPAAANPASEKPIEQPTTASPFKFEPSQFSYKDSKATIGSHGKDHSSVFSQSNNQQELSSNPFSTFDKRLTEQPAEKREIPKKAPNPFVDSEPTSPEESKTAMDQSQQAAPSIFSSGVGSTSPQPASAFQPPQPEAPKASSAPQQQQASLPQFTSPSPQPPSPTQSHTQPVQQPPSPSFWSRKTSQGFYKPDKPSPLAQSQSVEEEESQKDLFGDRTNQKKGKQPASELFPPSATLDSGVGSRKEASPAPSPFPAFQAAHAVTAPRHLEQDLATIVARLADEIVHEEPHGFLNQYIDFAVQQVVKQVKARFDTERDLQRAEAFRVRVLRLRYFQRWKDIFWSRKFAQRGNKRRERARKGLEESRRSLQGSRTGSTMGGAQSVEGGERMEQDFMQSVRQSQHSQANGAGAERQVTAGSKRPSDSQSVYSDTTADSRSQAHGHKRMKSSTYVDGKGRVAKPAVNPKSDPNGDILKRASFLGFSMPVKTNGSMPPPPARRSNYFRLKAAGVDSLDLGTDSRGLKRKAGESNTSDGAPTASSARASPVPSIGTPEADKTGFNMSALMRTTTAPAAPRFDGLPTSKASVGGSAKPDKVDDLLERVRKAREALAQGSKDFQEDMRKEEDMRKSLRSSASSGESPSMARARAEARWRASHGASMNATSSAADVPAYRLRESRFVPKEQYGKAIEQSKAMRASRSRETSRPGSRLEEHAQQSATFDFASPREKATLQDQASTVSFANFGQGQKVQQGGFSFGNSAQKTLDPALIGFSSQAEGQEAKRAAQDFAMDSQQRTNGMQGVDTQQAGFPASQSDWQPATFSSGGRASQRQSSADFDGRSDQVPKPKGSTGATSPAWQPPNSIAQNLSQGFFKPSQPVGWAFEDGADSQSHQDRGQMEESSGARGKFAKPAFGASSQPAFGASFDPTASHFGFGAQPRASMAPAVQEYEPSQLQQDHDVFGTEEPDSFNNEQSMHSDFTVKPGEVDHALSASFGNQEPSEPAGFAQATDMFGRPISQSRGVNQPAFPSFGQRSSPIRQEDSYLHTPNGEVNLVSDDAEPEDVQGTPAYANQFAQQLANAANGQLAEEEDEELIDPESDDEEEIQDSYQYSSNPYAALARDAGGDTEEDTQEDIEGEEFLSQADGEDYDNEEFQQPHGQRQRTAYDYEEVEYDYDEDPEGEEGDIEDAEEDSDSGDELVDEEETQGEPGSSFHRQYWSGFANGDEYAEDEEEDYDEEDEESEADVSKPIWNSQPKKNEELQGVGGTAEEAIELSD